MTVEEQVQDIMEADATLVASVPAARIKTPGDIQNLTRPYIVHFPVAVTPTQTHDGLKGLRIWDTYQVSVFASSYASGRAVADLARDALSASRSPMSNFWMALRHFFNEETKTHQFILEFKIAEAL